MIGAGSGFFIARIITLIIVIIVVIDLIGLIPAIIIDVKKKKFHWSKWIIISFVCVLVLFLVLNLYGNFIFNPADDSNMFPRLISPAPKGNL